MLCSIGILSCKIFNRTDLLNIYRPYDEDDEFQVASEQRSLKWSKKQLSALLGKPLVSNMGHAKYPTKSGQMIWPQLHGWFHRFRLLLSFRLSFAVYSFSL